MEDLWFCRNNFMLFLDYIITSRIVFYASGVLAIGGFVAIYLLTH